MKYPFTIYTDRGLKDFGDGTYQAARAIGQVILVRPTHRGDAGLVAHEVEHVKQWAIVSLLACSAIGLIDMSLWPAGIGAFSVLYALVPEFRLWAEVEAYKVQSSHYADDRLPKFAKFIAERYSLRVREDAALSLLRED